MAARGERRWSRDLRGGLHRLAHGADSLFSVGQHDRAVRPRPNARAGNEKGIRRMRLRYVALL